MGKMVRWSVPILALGCLGLFRGDVCATPRIDSYAAIENVAKVGNARAVASAALQKGNLEALVKRILEDPKFAEDLNVYKDIITNFLAFGASVGEMNTLLGSTTGVSPFQKIQAFVKASGADSLDKIPPNYSEAVRYILDRLKSTGLDAANTVNTAVGGDEAQDVMANVKAMNVLLGNTSATLVSFIKLLKEQVDPSQNLTEGLNSIDRLLGGTSCSPLVPFFRNALRALGVESLDQLELKDLPYVRDILDSSQETALDAANTVRTAVGGDKAKDVMTNVMSLMGQLAGANEVRTAVGGNAAADVLANVNTANQAIRGTATDLTAQIGKIKYPGIIGPLSQFSDATDSDEAINNLLGKITVVDAQKNPKSDGFYIALPSATSKTQFNTLAALFAAL